METLQDQAEATTSTAEPVPLDEEPSTPEEIPVEENIAAEGVTAPPAQLLCLPRASSAFRWSPTALAFSNTTPWLARILLPAACIATHILFLYGQTAPMWKLHANADIDTWANATSTRSKTYFNGLGIKRENHLVYEEDQDMQTFTYYYAINHLWQARGIPGKILPRMAAVLLIVFSGIWPHVKLLFLHLTWFFSKQASQRTSTLQWLSTLGKWSLADVLVVCVMVGVLNLDWEVDPAAIKNGIIADLPAILEVVKTEYDSTGLCSMLLKIKCETTKNILKITKCKACSKLVSEAYKNPEWAKSTGKDILKGVDTSGGGSATLRVVGMRGIYAFCGAVIVSILLSLMVDIFDHRAKRELKKEEELAMGQRRLERLERAMQEGEPEQQPNEEGNGSHDPLVVNGRTSPLELENDEETEFLQSPRSPQMFTYRFLVTVVVSISMVFFAVDWFTMERRVFGAGPDLLHDILGVNWERKYSLRTLMWTTGSHGGWDYMLMGTFALFCVLGPCIRAVLLLVVTWFDRYQFPVRIVAAMVNFIGAFCSWEVFAIAIVMVQMLMPSITNTIIRNKACAKISDDESCLQVEFNVLPIEFSTILIGGILLSACSYVATSRSNEREFASPGARTTEDDEELPSARLARVMAANREYERLQGVGQETSEAVDGELHELVFETNQV